MPFWRNPEGIPGEVSVEFLKDSRRNPAQFPEEFLEESWRNSQKNLGEILGGISQKILKESQRNSWWNHEQIFLEGPRKNRGGFFFGESERNFFKNTGIDGTILDDSSWESGQNSWRHPIGIPVGILEKILEESRRKIWRNTGKMSGGFFMRNPERNLVGIPEDYHCGASEEFPEENLEKSWYNGG